VASKEIIIPRNERKRKIKNFTTYNATTHTKQRETTCTKQRTVHNTRIRHPQHAIRNTQRTTRNTQHAKRKTQNATHNTQHNTQHTARNMQHAIYSSKRFLTEDIFSKKKPYRPKKKAIKNWGWDTKSWSSLAASPPPQSFE
jgi:hypothetical protein